MAKTLKLKFRNQVERTPSGKRRVAIVLALETPVGLPVCTSCGEIYVSRKDAAEPFKPIPPGMIGRILAVQRALVEAYGAGFIAAAFHADHAMVIQPDMIEAVSFTYSEIEAELESAVKAAAREAEA